MSTLLNLETYEIVDQWFEFIIGFTKLAHAIIDPLAELDVGERGSKSNDLKNNSADEIVIVSIIIFFVFKHKSVSFKRLRFF